MTVISPSATDLSMEGETLANDYHWRSTKAKQQLRDRFGRWISLGANIRFRGDGAEQSGVVTSVIDGKAYVDQKNLDGTISQKIIDPSAIRVIASKATLPPDGKKIRDEGNNFAAALKTPEFLNALDSAGEAVIERADGYALAANLVDEAQGGENVVNGKPAGEGESVSDKSKGNNIMYQLFAPAGRSLGKYGQAAEPDFDDMVSEDQGAGGQIADTAPTGGGEVAPAAVAASVEVTSSERPYRVPESVKSEILNTISSLSVELPEADLAVATRLANDSTVSMSDVEWIHGFFSENELSESIRGGFKGRKWATKIVESGDEITAPDDIDVDTHPKYAFDDEVSGYFAVGKYAGSTLVHKLIAVDYESGMVSTWSADGFEVIPDLDMKEVDEPQIIPIDEMTADAFAHWLDSGTAEEFDILDTNPEERNLFTLADSEIDYDELDRSYSIIAAAGDGVYTPVERSQNAKVQQRGSGGKFGETPDAVAVVPEGGEAPKVQKATLPVELPIVVDPAARIAEWLSTAAEAPVVAAGEASGTPEYTEEDQAVEDAATGPTDEALYFAIVDEVDKAAVLDAIAIVKSSGAPSAFLRQAAAWVGSPDTLTLLQGSTPPTVVELPDPATVKTVLEQIDAHDAGADMTPDPSEAALPKPGEVPLAASGYAMSDGSYTILNAGDLKNAVAASAGTTDIFVKAHIRKRGRALNRMDVVPYAWREFTLAEIGELSADRHAYGEFGEILVASAARKGGGNGAQLKAYWTTGKGALKIRWGTKGDLTRAHKHLAKYVGPERSWGLAQSYHQSLFGVYNHTHDVATGQYSPRRKK